MLAKARHCQFSYGPKYELYVILFTAVLQGHCVITFTTDFISSTNSMEILQSGFDISFQLHYVKVICVLCLT